ncbi:DNA-binding protein [Amycolatopsis sp. WAC 01376]|uniref:DNA-binding protein n=1 Tax=Amycolatopsis sp. WAC 01376 TaxID=2203195 RepID=UPI000F7AEC14|nr:DNA-binding protein [Amycolatopsis sp. WAC 01376]RSM57481.1 DNA-binding protein [Amycolatopsis sp. WAC 01376]
MDDQSELPPGIGKPATRAFTGAGYTRLEDFTRATEAELACLHGVGPKALRIIREALETRGQTYKPTE